jgi:hypothetical protein
MNIGTVAGARRAPTLRASARGISGKRKQEAQI